MKRTNDEIRQRLDDKMKALREKYPQPEPPPGGAAGARYFRPVRPVIQAGLRGKLNNVADRDSRSG